MGDDISARRQGLTALRDRIAKATHGSHELDVMLCDALDVDIGQLSQSLDAAVTLVPEGCVWLRKSAEAMTICLPGPHDGWGRHFDATGATPALALCLARIEYELSKDPADG